MDSRKPYLTIPFELPTMNQIISAAHTRRGKVSPYNILKNKKQIDMRPFIVSVKRIEFPVKIHFWWYRINKRTNPDNIDAGGRKFVLDALQDFGKLDNDNWHWLRGFSSDFDVDKDNPRVEVYLHTVI